MPRLPELVPMGITLPEDWDHGEESQMELYNGFTVFIDHNVFKDKSRGEEYWFLYDHGLDLGIVGTKQTVYVRMAVDCCFERPPCGRHSLAECVWLLRKFMKLPTALTLLRRERRKERQRRRVLRRQRRLSLLATK